jgi:hypothetical protein
LTDAVRRLLEAFDSLSEREKHEAAVALLGRIADTAPAQVPEIALIEAAEELFQELDSEDCADDRE